MILGRLLLRFLLVPLGGCVAIVVAVLFIMVANWSRFAALVAADAGGDKDFFMAIIFVGAWIMFTAAISASVMMLPATLGALIAEAFAIRSWMFHVANGGLSALIGFKTTVDLKNSAGLYNEPVVIVGAGIVAGFAYWAVAGWSAGFWKPVFAAPPQVEPPGQPLPGAPPGPPLSPPTG